jgi:hypothetical protein
MAFPIIAILWPSHPALISSRRRAGAVGDGINRGAPARQGMGFRGATIVGQRGVENFTERLRRYAMASTLLHRTACP